MSGIGSVGEKLAGNYLIQKGYTVIQKNYRTRYGEIDLIARKNNIIIFVEVKTRQTDSKGKPYASVTPRKLIHQRRAIQWFLSAAPENKHCKLRFDIISIEMNFDGNPIIEHFENIELP